MKKTPDNPGPHRWAMGLILAVSIALIMSAWKNQGSSMGKEGVVAEGVVLKILSEREVAQDDVAFIGASKIQKLMVSLHEGGGASEVEAENQFVRVKPGETVYITKSPEVEQAPWEVTEISRAKGLMWLALLFVLIVVAVAGRKGLSALIGLVFSFAVIVSYILPQILNGVSPIAISIIGSFMILSGTLYMSYGWSRKTFAALLGITITLSLVGFFAQAIIQGLHFTGFSGEEAAFLKQEAGKINLTGLLIAGVMIAAIGVLDDIAVTQAATALMLHEMNPAMGRREVFKKAMEIGKDHIAAVINTLALAYTGAALPLLLLFSIQGLPTGYAISVEMVAEEIVRTLISSAGLVLAVPITTLIACSFAFRTRSIEPGCTPRGGTTLRHF